MCRLQVEKVFYFSEKNPVLFSRNKNITLDYCEKINYPICVSENTGYSFSFLEENMGAVKKTNRNQDWDYLQIRASSELPEHKLAASLDDLDREIIEMHQKDMFFSYSDLAEKWNVTAATIRNRIKRLKSSGVMDMILVLNPFKIGYDTFAVIGIKLEIGAEPDEVVSTLHSIPGVSNVIMVAGRYDIFIHYVCQNMEEYRRFVSENLRKVPGIANIESFLGLDLFKRKFELGVVS